MREGGKEGGRGRERGREGGKVCDRGNKISTEVRGCTCMYIASEPSGTENRHACVFGNFTYMCTQIKNQPVEMARSAPLLAISHTHNSILNPHSMMM